VGGGDGSILAFVAIVAFSIDAKFMVWDEIYSYTYFPSTISDTVSPQSAYKSNSSCAANVPHTTLTPSA